MPEPEHLPERKQFDRLRADIGAQVLVQLVTDPEGRAFLQGILRESAPSVMDATRAQLADALLRARHAVAAAETVLSVSWGPHRTLGELMRDPIWSDEERERIVDNFIRAGIS
ncbi:hypothetical protein ACFV19_22725 [Streptomyces griseoluteus]|uniref:hypothetical protein n=1 Tax=Streptomyces griseoluteus TaxID=29306 RepID=UPI00367796B6